ncbi:GNAT family N-acyltransferase [Nostoc sp. DedSLP04]|nr:GNAT family N-acyltransferase [Nostoc sp. DedSLP04]MDZ8035802.1 GNAT family N-acyltransferase [Nostoc sp. DedSLP04]
MRSVGYQISEFDTVCYHLILILKPTGKIVGDYRSIKTLANTSC